MLRRSARSLLRACAPLRLVSSGADGVGGSSRVAEWADLASKGVRVNPCGSALHPAVKAGVLPLPQEPACSVQEAYDPHSVCFACGPAAAAGIHLSSYRSASGGLRSEVVVPESFVELPGMVSHGVLAALCSCHGVWVASVALMDKAVLARPPLLVVQRLQLEYNVLDFAAPGVPLEITSRVLALHDEAEPYSVEVWLSCRERTEEGDDPADAIEYASGVASFTKIGAARSLGY